MATTVFEYGLMDWGARQLTVLVGTQGRAFDQFFQTPGGMLAAGIDLHINGSVVLKTQKVTKDDK